MATRTDKVQTIFEAQDKNFTDTQKKVGKGFKHIDEEGKKVKKGFVSMLGSIKDVATAFAGLAITAGAINYGAGAIQAAIDAEKIENKFRVVFGSVEKRSQKMAADLAKNYGLAKSEAKELLAGTGDLLTGFGFTDKEALKLSGNVQRLSVDLASFNNLQGGSKQASEILTKALLGERDALTTLGVKISEVDIQNKLAADGKDELTGNALLAAKAEATYALVLSQTKKAQGDFARSADSVANKQRVLQARMADVRVEVGRKLLPIYNTFLEALLQVVPIISETIENGWNKLTETIETVSTFVRENWGIVQPLLIGFAAAVATVLVPAFVGWAIAAGAAAIATIAAAAPFVLLIGGITLLVAAIVWLIQNFDLVKQKVGEAFGALAQSIGNGLTKARDFIVNLFGQALQWLVDRGNDVRNGIANAFSSIGETVGNTIQGIRDRIANFFSGVANVGNNIVSVFKQLINQVVDRLNKALEFEIDILGGKVFVDLPDLPRLATGTQYFGGGQALVGENGPEIVNLPRGSKVITNDKTEQMGTSGNTYNNYNYFQEQVDMGRVVARLAFNTN